MQDDIKKTINWPEIFSDYKNSGLNQKQYCDREGIKYFEFKYHRTKYLKQQGKRSDFASIKVQRTNYDLEICLSPGSCLKFNATTPVDYVKRLLSVLR
jgi:hypothetical protein